MGWKHTDDTKLVRAWLERYRRLSILENVLVARVNADPTLLPTLMFTTHQNYDRCKEEAKALNEMEAELKAKQVRDRVVAAQKEIEDALECLSEKQRVFVQLRYVQGLSAAVVKQRLGSLTKPMYNFTALAQTIIERVGREKMQADIDSDMAEVHI